MAKTLRNGRARGEGRFVMLHHWMLTALAWRGLSPFAKCSVLAVWERFAGDNNGRIPLSRREAAAIIRCSEPTAWRALQEAVARGFLVCRQKGDYKLKPRHASEWELTALPVGNEPARKTFMRPASTENLEHGSTTFTRGSRRHPQNRPHG
ncbi:MAG: hypothetical protein EXQ94_06535 [Alphaproteobacteria bacterium]|nr:hypothetical protein [Alphaproteobacteria bacterium]